MSKTKKMDLWLLVANFFILCSGDQSHPEHANIASRYFYSVKDISIGETSYSNRVADPDEINDVLDLDLIMEKELDIKKKNRIQQWEIIQIRP